MKKVSSSIIIVIICLILLILGFCIVGYYLFTSNNKDSIFEKEKECYNLSDRVKQHLSEDTFNNEIGKSEIGKVDTWYNKDLDTCLANVSINIELYLEAKANNFTQHNLYDVYNGYNILEKCTSPDGCYDEYLNILKNYKKK